jgi:TFIIF-interacting CTD phosphatase-like protein
MIDKYNRITKAHTVDNLNEFNELNQLNEIDKLNLVLDLDNTIIYTKIFDTNDILKIKFYELFRNNNLLGKFTIDCKIYLVYTRPYFSFFLNTIKMYFNIYIYTNSHSIYCQNIINLLRNKFLYFEIKKIICRNNNCDSLIKQLSKIYDCQDDLHFLVNSLDYEEFIKKTIIIDDNIDVWKFDEDNLIEVKYFNEHILQNKLIDDTLLILTNRLFIIHNNYISNYNNFNIKNLISKYKLYNN